MPRKAGGARRRQRPKANGANLGFEETLWQATDALRNNMDAAEYKHVVLGLISLKYISDAFDETHARLEAERVTRIAATAMQIKNAMGVIRHADYDRMLEC